MHKKILWLLPTLVILGQAAIAEKSPITEKEKISYSLGVKTAENYSAQDIPVDPQQFAAGMGDFINKSELKLTQDQIQDTITQLQKTQVAKMEQKINKLASDNLSQSTKFLEENGTKEGIVTTDTGLQYQELESGAGSSPTDKDYVTVNYRGMLLDGTEFDSSYSRNESSTFQVSNLIPGWQEALTLMKPGSKWKIFVPPELAYGEHGAGGIIGPNSALIFELELIDVKTNN